MNKFIKLLLNQRPPIVDINDSIEIVESSMGSRRKTDCVIVTKPDGKCFGIITNSDLKSFFEQRRNPKTVKAWELCSHNVIFANEGTSIKEISDLMTKNKIHHILILENGVAQGCVSSNDVAEYDFVKNYLDDGE